VAEAVDDDEGDTLCDGVADREALCVMLGVTEGDCERLGVCDTLDEPEADGVLDTLGDEEGLGVDDGLGVRVSEPL